MIMKFLANIIFMRITCVPNFMAKRFIKKLRYLKSINICSYEKKFTTTNFDTLPRIAKKNLAMKLFHRHVVDIFKIDM